jgi:hypothetical protein
VSQRAIVAMLGAQAKDERPASVASETILELRIQLGFFSFMTSTGLTELYFGGFPCLAGFYPRATLRS